MSKTSHGMRRTIGTARVALGVASGSLLALAAPAAAAPTVLGPDAASCRAGVAAPALLVHVDGFKARTGNLRVQVYGANPSDFLAKGRKLARVDLPVTVRGAMDVCVALPAAGRYAVAVRHDIDGSGKSSWNDGGGFSRNPKLSLLALKPRYEDVAIEVARGLRPIEIMLCYREGFSIRPVASAAS